MGDYRNILDIAQVLQDKLGPDTCGHSNAEIEKRVKRLEPVGFEVMTDGERGHIQLSQRPGGCNALRNGNIEFGCRSRLQQRATTWPLAR